RSAIRAGRTRMLPPARRIPHATAWPIAASRWSRASPTSAVLLQIARPWAAPPSRRRSRNNHARTAMAHCAYREVAVWDELLNRNYKKRLGDTEPGYREAPKKMRA